MLQNHPIESRDLGCVTGEQNAVRSLHAELAEIETATRDSVASG